jgi:WhiB family redox-sensing transcriptional regulator
LLDFRWRRDAYCYTHDINPEVFEDPGNVETAKAICRRCSVTDHCLAEALSIKGGAEGVWGGTTDDERRALKRGGHRATCPGCLATKIYSDGVSEICVSCGFAWRA